MPNIDYYLKLIRNAVYGREVREAIASGIELTNNNTVKITTTTDGTGITIFNSAVAEDSEETADGE